MGQALKFGKFKGFTLEQIISMPEGRGYLEWLRDNTETTGKYAAQNKALVAEVNAVLNSAGPVAQSPAPSNQSTTLLSNILKTLQNIEKILANPKQTHIATTELEPDENVPF